MSKDTDEILEENDVWFPPIIKARGVDEGNIEAMSLIIVFKLVMERMGLDS